MNKFRKTFVFMMSAIFLLQVFSIGNSVLAEESDLQKGQLITPVEMVAEKKPITAIEEVENPKIENQQETTNSTIQTTETEGDYSYYDIEGGVVISSYNGNGGEVIIPSNIKGKKVLKISDNGFYGCTSLTSISLPESLASIGDYAFYGCASLTSINLPESMTSIGNGAFGDCNSLSSISLPESVINIGEYAFEKCRQLTQIKIPKNVIEIGTGSFKFCDKLMSIDVSPENLKFISNDGALFNRKGDCLIACPGGLTSFEIPIGVVEISSHAFDSCYQLTRIKLPVGITKIDDSAFEFCINLTNISIPEGVTSIGNSAFDACNQLNQIILPESLISIGEFAFRDCSQLTSVEIPESVRDLGIGIFNGCQELNNLTVVDNNQNYSSINGLLYNKTGSVLILALPTAEKCTIPEGVTEIGKGAFYNNKNLAKVSISKSIKKIGDDAFRGCDGLMNISLPDGILSIGNRTFYECTNLSNVDMPDSLSTIGEEAFFRCINLKVMTIPKSVTRIEKGTFQYCTALTSIMMPEGLASIGETCFSNCMSLEKIELPKNLVNIDGYAFEYCRSLTDISIPKGMKNLGNGLFVDCSNLRSVILEEGITSISNGLFQNCSSLASIIIPQGTTTISYNAFGNCENLTRVSVPDSVQKIEFGAFSNCPLVQIYGRVGTYAQSYAQDFNLPFFELGSFTLESFTADKFAGMVDAEVSLTATASGGTAPYVYKFYYQLESAEAMIQDYSASHTAKFKPQTEGTYTLCVEVKDSLGATRKMQINNCVFINGVSSDTTDTRSKDEIIKKYNELIKLNGFYGHDTTYDIEPVYSNGTYIAGKVNDQNILEGLNTVNMIRYIAGLDSVEGDDSLSQTAQAGTTGLAACNVLAHSIPQLPDMPDDFYKLASKGVGSSNLGWGHSNIPSSIVNGYMMDDDGSNIDRVGHRRWILNPKMGKIGFGQTDSFTATYVFDQSNDKAAYNAVTWPAKGDFPIEYFSYDSRLDDTSYKKYLCTNPWSISLGSDYDVISENTVAVTITRTSDGKVMTFNRDTNKDTSDLSKAYFNVSYVLYGGLPCLIFKPAESDLGTYGDMIGETYTVKVTGIAKNNIPTELSYNVNFFELMAGVVDTGKADAVIAQINALPSVEALTLNDQPAVKAAREAYEALTKVEKDLINAGILKKLTDVELKIAELAKNNTSCIYQTHVQDIGWQEWKADGEISGTSGQSKRLEGIRISVNNLDGDVGVEYSTHVQNIGWQEMKKDGDMSGTSGESLRLEAINIKLTGTDADKYDIYYCVHAQNIGWMDWAKNGENSGTAGFGYRLEAIQIKIVPKGDPAPGATVRPFVSKN